MLAAKGLQIDIRVEGDLDAAVSSCLVVEDLRKLTVVGERLEADALFW